jgi:hypothetical protein
VETEVLTGEENMRRTRLSLIYVVAYLLGAGIFLLIGLGMFVAQIIRHGAVALYPTTLAVRAVFCTGFIALYLLSRDPLFLVLLAVVGLGVVATSVSYLRDSRDGAL